MNDYISEVIERSRLKFNPRLPRVCLELIRLSDKDPTPNRRCWRLMQTLFMIEQSRPMNLPYYWFKEGIVVDPASLTQQTCGIVMFKWDEQCPGCQIEEECPCEGNPHNKSAKGEE